MPIHYFLLEKGKNLHKAENNDTMVAVPPRYGLILLKSAFKEPNMNVNSFTNDESMHIVSLGWDSELLCHHSGMLTTYFGA